MSLYLGHVLLLCDSRKNTISQILDKGRCNRENADTISYVALKTLKKLSPLFVSNKLREHVCVSWVVREEWRSSVGYSGLLS